MAEIDSTRIHIPDELFLPAESAHFSGSADLDIMKVGPDLYTFDGPLTWDVDITNTGEALLLEGTCEVEGKTACARCGEAACVPLFGEVEGYFLIDAQTAQLDDMEGDEYEVLPDDRCIDLMPLMRSSLVLDIPVIPLCADDCKGLCPVCGKNLNEGPCDCIQEESVGANNPFAALKDFVADAEG